MHLFILAIIIQLILVGHALKTGRSNVWVFLMLLFPIIAGLAYILIELLPEWTGPGKVVPVKDKDNAASSQDRDLHAAATHLKRNDTVDNAIKLARECERLQRFDEAIELYQRALTGIYSSDPQLLELLARAQFNGNHFADCRTTLERLIAENPDYKSRGGHLLYAECLFQLNDSAKAREEFSALNNYCATAQVKYRLAQLLLASGETDDAKALIISMLEENNAVDPDGSDDQDWLTLAQQWRQRGKPL